MTDIDLKELERELLVNSDVRAFIQIVQRTFDEEHEKCGLTKTDLAKLVGRDLSYVSRILNGRQNNVTVYTLVNFMRAMGRRLEPTQSRIADLEARKSNYVMLPEIKVAEKRRPHQLRSYENAEVINGARARSQTYSPDPSKLSLGNDAN